MNFNDVLKSSFLEKAVSISLSDVCIALVLALAVSMFIYYIYKKTFAGVMYSRSFGISIVAMTLITTIIILAITSNVVLSLGMVGALSIVRFRTAVKEPLDIVFLFWAVSAGIVVGAGLFPLAIVGSLLLGIVLLVLVNCKTRETPYILIAVMNGTDAENAVLTLIKEETKRYVVKSKTVSEGRIELTVEVRVSSYGDECALVNKVLAVHGMESASLVSYNGEYAN